MKRFGTLSVLILLSTLAFSQIVIRSGTSIAFPTSEKPDIVVDAPGNITTNGASDFSGSNLQLNVSANVSITGNLVVKTFRLLGGNATINNELTITEGMEFTMGFLTPAGSGKILFTGGGNSITGGGATSFVNGMFYQAGGGFRFYPLGAGSTYAPAVFENVGTTSDVGAQLFTEDPALVFDPVEILSINSSRYWAISTADPAGINTRVSLSLTDIPSVSEGSFAVIQSDAPSGNAVSLGFSSLDEAQVTSRAPVTGLLLAIGVVPEIVVKVRDLITPYLRDEINDKLYIEKIEAFDFNTVTLLDRWGVVVKRWENFTNDVDYDFSKLGPGNYIVVVEYGNLAEGSTIEKISQMVTVLKTN